MWVSRRVKQINIHLGKKRIVTPLFHVDDSCVFGARSDMDDVTMAVKKVFTIKTEGGPKDFLGCEILRDEREETADCCSVSQPHLIKKLVKTFRELLKCERKTKTPGTPRAVQVVPKEDSDKLDAEEHHKFRSGVGMLLQMLKHSRTEPSNPMRELTRCMSGPGPKNMKEMHGIVKWVLDLPSVG